MATNIVHLTPGYYPSSSIGRPLASADIYVGIPDLDPEIVANQKTLSVQQEDGTVVAVSQPISTNAGGVPQYLGSPVTLLVEGDYSLKVLDSAGSQIYYVPSLASQAALIPGNYFYPAYNETDQGAAGDGNSVFDILTEVGAATKATMFFAHNSGAATTTYTFATSEIITDNFNIIIEDGALLSPSAGKTLTIDGPLNAGAYQIFSGAGTITISSVILEHDQWRDGAGDDILPSVDNAIDLGSPTQEFKDLYIDGTANIDDLVAGTIDFGGTAISATAAEINTVADGITATAAQINAKANSEAFVNNANGNPNISDTILDVDSVVAEAAWESIGPTGSGADNIWTALDSVPSGVDWVEIRVIIFGTNGAINSSLASSVFVRKNGSSEAAASDNIISEIRDRSDAAGNSFGGGVSVWKTPVLSRVFDIYYTSGFTTDDISLVLVGYGYNP